MAGIHCTTRKGYAQYCTLEDDHGLLQIIHVHKRGASVKHVFRRGIGSHQSVEIARLKLMSIAHQCAEI